VSWQNTLARLDSFVSNSALCHKRPSCGALLEPSSRYHVRVIFSHIFQALNAAAQRNSKVQLQVGEKAKREASAIKAMAPVIMTFLPATFVSVTLPVAMYRPSCVRAWLTEPVT
jgi:hypothetical protein